MDYVLFGKDLRVNVENSPVRTFMLFPKQVTFTPWGQLVLGITLKLKKWLNPNYMQNGKGMGPSILLCWHNESQ